MSKEAYELLAMYDFSVQYSDAWEVELRPHSTETAGDIAFKTPGVRIFLTWGSLERIKRKFRSLDSQAESSVKRMRKSGDVRRFEILDHREMTVNGHRAIFDSTRLKVTAGLLGMRTGQRQVYSIHLHCEQSQRFFVLYANEIEGQPEIAVLDVLSRMGSTLKCHQKAF